MEINLQINDELEEIKANVIQLQTKLQKLEKTNKGLQESLNEFQNQKQLNNYKLDEEERQAFQQDLQREQLRSKLLKDKLEETI